jgi:ribosome maturation protein Sdo1
LAAFGAADPVKYERKKDAVRVAKEAAQRWTGKLSRIERIRKLMVDNTITLMQYIKTTMQVEDERLRTMLGIGKFGRVYAELICR